jgi:hypothetical protein
MIRRDYGRGQWRALVNTVRDLQIHLREEKFLIN